MSAESLIENNRGLNVEVLLVKKKQDATIVVVSVCFSLSLEPFKNSKQFAFKRLQYCFTANIYALLNQKFEIAN